MKGSTQGAAQTGLHLIQRMRPGQGAKEDDGKWDLNTEPKRAESVASERVHGTPGLLGTPVHCGLRLPSMTSMSLLFFSINGDKTVLALQREVR